MKTILTLILLSLLATACQPQETPPPVEPPPTETPEDPETPGNPETPTNPNPQTYLPIGVGGGGALSGVSISPYSNLWFVGTDMGTLFRSTDKGQSWIPVNHLQAVFDSDLTRAVSPGFSSDGTTVFHASKGVNPKRSLDSGLTFSAINMGLQASEYIRFWHSDSSNENVIFAGTNYGMLRTENKGTSWSRLSGITEEARGMFIDQTTKSYFMGTPSGVWRSGNGIAWTKFYTPSGVQLRLFTGGRDANGITLAFADNDGSHACSWVYPYLAEWGQTSIDNTVATCGYVWTSLGSNTFVKNSQVAGDHLKMAENDANTIYVTGGRKWIRQYGTKVHVSKDKGQSWNLKLHQMNWDVVPFAAWDPTKLEYSAVAMDVGWWDDGYESFEVNQKNSAEAGGSGYFFLHSTLTTGDKWLAPFTQYADTGTAAAKKKWKTRGIEVISIYRMEYHPSNPNLLYAASADIGGMISEDGGTSFRVSKAQYNSNYDYSFDVNNQNVVYAASGNSHDWPNEWHSQAITSNGGIYKSSNKGMSWQRLTPDNAQLNRQFLSVGYDSISGAIYGGTHEVGIYRSVDQGQTWALFNTGLPTGNKIIPQIEVNPHNGNVYALLTGDAPTFSNQAKTGIYFLDVAHGSTTWTLLRGTVQYPADADPGYKLWYYPTAFAIDFDHPENLWMVDYENKGNWLMTGVWKSTDNGANWKRMKQLTHATDVKIDPNDSNRIYASGYYTLDGSWGNGGQYFSKDGGLTWSKNTTPPLQQNSRSVVIDPTNSDNLIYSYFGGGMLKGRNPASL